MTSEILNYPYVDDQGTTWLDANTFTVPEWGACFFCGNDTHRVDINYAWYYCGLDDDLIAEDLRRLDEVAQTFQVGYGEAD